MIHFLIVYVSIPAELKIQQYPTPKVDGKLWTLVLQAFSRSGERAARLQLESSAGQIVCCKFEINGKKVIIIYVLDILVLSI